MNTEVQKLLKKDACGKPENTVFKVPVKFLSRTINPAAPAIIFLSTPNPPELGGLLTVNIYGRNFCEWPISKWSDYSTAADRSLIIMFTESGKSGESYGYQLNFNTDRDLTEFMTTMRSLQSGDYSSSAAPNTMVIPAANSSVRVADARAPGKIQGELRSTHALSGTAAVVSTASHNPLCEIASYASQDKMPAKKTGNPEKGATVITRQPPTKGDSHETSEGSASSSTLTQKQILNTCSSLLHVFLFGGLEGKTKEEVGQTVEGIKAGVLDHVMHDARSQGLNSQSLQEIETLILGVFESLPSTAPKQKRRFQYSIEELMSMRHAAAKPPACLANLPPSYLPKSQNSGRKTSTSTHEAQISRSATAMQWVLQADSSKPESGSGAAKADATRADKAPQPKPKMVPSAAGSEASRDTGLQNSRWASGGDEVKHANYFTGPAYEKEWPMRRGYLDELMQLDPQAQVTAGAEVVVDFYFPSHGDGKALAGSEVDNPGAPSGVESPRPASTQPVQMLPPAQPLAVPTPHPSQASAQVVQSPAPQPQLRGLGSSRHSAGNAPSSAGQFNFVIPNSGRR